MFAVRLQQAVGVRYFCIIGVCQTVKRCAARVLSSIPSKAFVPVVSVSVSAALPLQTLRVNQYQPASWVPLSNWCFPH